MRCHICDKALTEAEGQFNKELNEREPCSVCLEIALDAAYSGGFSHDEESPVLIEEDEYRSYFDHCDAHFPKKGGYDE